MKYDYVIVGGGTMGRSSALYLNILYPQSRCALIQQYKYDHEEGSSHSKTRIIRSAYSQSFYRDLSIKSYNSWKQLQKLFKKKLIHPQSYLKFIQIDKMYEQHVKVAKESGSIKQMSCEQVKKLYPSGPDIDLKGKNVFVEEGGVVMAQTYLKTILQYLQSQQNIDIYQQTQVIEVLNDKNGVNLKLKSKKGIYEMRADKVAMACGRWIGKLLPNLRKVLRPIRQIVSFWQMADSEQYSLSKYPCWCLQTQQLNIFSLPDVEGDGMKYGIHSYQYEDQSKFTQESYIKQKLEELFKYMQKHFKGRVVKLKKLDNCYYTYTKSQDFLIDWTDQKSNILIVSPCSGHGFKFSPIIGQIVADLLKKDKSFDLFEQNRYLMRLSFHQGIDLS